MSFGIVWYPANLEVYIYRPIESSNFKRVFLGGWDDLERGELGAGTVLLPLLDVCCGTCYFVTATAFSHLQQSNRQRRFNAYFIACVFLFPHSPVLSSFES